MMSGDDLYDDETTSGLAYDRLYERTGTDPLGLYGPVACHKAGHVDGCPGMAGGDHELREGWIAFEQDGDLIEVETI